MRCRRQATRWTRLLGRRFQEHITHKTLAGALFRPGARMTWPGNSSVGDVFLKPGAPEVESTALLVAGSALAQVAEHLVDRVNDLRRGIASSCRAPPR